MFGRKPALSGVKSGGSQSEIYIRRALRLTWGRGGGAPGRGLWFSFLGALGGARVRLFCLVRCMVAGAPKRLNGECGVDFGLKNNRMGNAHAISFFVWAACYGRSPVNMAGAVFGSARS